MEAQADRIKEAGELCDEFEELVKVVRRAVEARTYEWPNKLTEFVSEFDRGMAAKGGQEVPMEYVTTQMRHCRDVLHMLPGVDR